SNSWRDVKTARDTRIGPFLSMTTCAPDEIWLTGDHGLARLIVAPDPSTYGWTEINGDRYGLRDFVHPLPGGGGELFAQAGFGGCRRASTLISRCMPSRKIDTDGSGSPARTTCWSWMAASGNATSSRQVCALIRYRPTASSSWTTTAFSSRPRGPPT